MFYRIIAGIRSKNGKKVYHDKKYDFQRKTKHLNSAVFPEAIKWEAISKMGELV